MEQKLRCWIGIDPGTKGSICALREDNVAIFLDTLTLPHEMIDWFNQINYECDLQIIMIENVHAMSNSSAKASFSFGWNACKLEVLPLALGLSVDKVNPKKWQKAVGVRSTVKQDGMKKEVASICQRLYPLVTIHGPRGGLKDGKSDALMIAHYAKLTYR